MKHKTRWYHWKNRQIVPVEEITSEVMQPYQERMVGYTEFPNGAYISTIFLGLDHGWDDGPPVLWESMIFWTDSPLDNDQDRYTSRPDAVAGHLEMIRKVQEAIEGS